ncbi:MAG: DUF3842 family protein [Clostridiales bacterium]|nr:DUF3842 family protein [Clostridiales bacterium]
MRIAVVDGQGGGIGKSVIEHIRKAIKDDTEIIALGTNSLATSNMLKAGADEGATGENAICVTAQKVDIIIGPLAIVLSDSMLGEISQTIATAIARSPAKKMLLPMNRCGVFVAGVKNKTIQDFINEIVSEIQELKNQKV